MASNDRHNWWHEPAALDTMGDDVVNGYIEAAAFTGMSNPEDEGFGCEFSAEALDKAKADCSAFMAACEADAPADGSTLLETLEDMVPDYTKERLGRDFWFTRNGHGVGFWSRPELEPMGIGDRLSAIAKRFGEVDIYRGDDGKVYFA